MAEMEDETDARSDFGPVQRKELWLLIDRSIEILRKVEAMSEALEVLTQKVDELTTVEETVASNVTAVVDEVVMLEKEITELREKGAGPEVNEAATALAERVSKLTTGLDATVEALKSAEPQPKPEEKKEAVPPPSPPAGA